jgi:hypothetical protein
VTTHCWSNLLRQSTIQILERRERETRTNPVATDSSRAGVMRTTRLVSALRVFLSLLLVQSPWQSSPAVVDAAGGGTWEVVVQNAGIASMHTAVTHYGNVVLLDRTNIGPSQLSLPKGVCRNNPLDRVRKLLSIFASDSAPAPKFPLEFFRHNSNPRENRPRYMSMTSPRLQKTNLLSNARLCN